MNEIRFNSLKELYDRLLPALRSKVKELKRENITYVKEEDVWEILRQTKWNNCKTLTLYDMVDDILNSDNQIFQNYAHKKLEEIKPIANTEGESLL